MYCICIHNKSITHYIYFRGEYYIYKCKGVTHNIIKYIIIAIHVNNMI